MISGSEDGDIGIYEYTLAQLLLMLAECGEFMPATINKLKDKNKDVNNDPMYWGDSILIIKGEIKVPQPKETVKSWGI